MNSYTLQSLLHGSSYARRSGCASCGSAGGGPIGDAPPRNKELDLRGPRLLIAKFRSRDGNRGVFFFISVNSFTESPSSQTIFRAILPTICTATLIGLQLTVDGKPTENSADKFRPKRVVSWMTRRLIRDNV